MELTTREAEALIGICEITWICKVSFQQAQGIHACSFFYFSFLFMSRFHQIFERQKINSPLSQIQRSFKLVCNSTPPKCGGEFSRKENNIFWSLEFFRREFFENSVLGFREDFLRKNYSFHTSLLSRVFALPKLLNKKSIELFPQILGLSNLAFLSIWFSKSENCFLFEYFFHLIGMLLRGTNLTFLNFGCSIWYMLWPKLKRPWFSQNVFLPWFTGSDGRCIGMR